MDYTAYLYGGVTIAGAVVAFFALGFLGVYHLDLIVQYLPDGVGPAETSLVLTCAAFAVGFVFALPLALLRAYAPAHLRRSKGLDREGVLWAPPYAIASAFVAIIRGTPFLVQMFLLWNVFIFDYPRLVLLGEPTSFWAGLVALTVNTTAYQAEAMRGGFQSVDNGQVEAGRALGLGRVGIFRRIVLPQGLRLVTLPLTNEWISTFKTSTIVGFFNVIELYYWAHNEIGIELARPIEAFVMLTIFYLTINVTLSRASTALERRYRIPGLGSMLPDIGVRSESLRR